MAKLIIHTPKIIQWELGNVPFSAQNKFFRFNEDEPLRMCLESGKWKNCSFDNDNCVSVYFSDCAIKPLKNFNVNNHPVNIQNLFGVSCVEYEIDSNIVDFKKIVFGALPNNWLDLMSIIYDGTPVVGKWK